MGRVLWQNLYQRSWDRRIYSLPGLIVEKGFSYIETKQESVQPAQSNHKIIFNAKDKPLQSGLLSLLPNA
jgi:hypothetical protein